MQYLNKDILLNGVNFIDFPSSDLISTDTYNEEDILNNFTKINKQGQILLLKATIHIGIIGSGNKTFGAIRNDNQVLQIEDIFKKYDILYNKKINEKYDKGSLSARRLVRLLRYHIQQFIRNTKRPSYLYLKYSKKMKNLLTSVFLVVNI